MDLGLDILGAGEGLASKYIVLRVRSIDTAKLKAKVGGAAGAVLPAALAIADAFPDQALEMALPFAKKQLVEMGITAEMSTMNAPPPPGPPTKPLLVGGVLVGVGLSVGGWYLYHWLAPKLGAKVK